MRSFKHFLWLLLAAGVLPGCGTPRSLTSRPTGSAILTIQWPPRSRLIPAASNSVEVTVLDLEVPIVRQVVDRPPTGGFSTVTLGNLPVGELTVAAVAFPLTGAQGTPQAVGRAPLTIQAGKTTDLVLTLVSTIAQVAIDPPTPTVAVGGTMVVNARAMTSAQAGGALVLVAPEKWAWKSENPAVATVLAHGAQATVTGVSPGTAKIIATDTESGVSGWVEVSVTAAPRSRLAIVRRLGPDVSNLFLVNPDGTNEVRLTSGNFLDDWPAWSPDGTRIAFRRATPGASEEIYVINADGTGLTRLVAPSDVDGDGAVSTEEALWGVSSPTWSPDGTQIAFGVHVHGYGRVLCAINADGTGFRRITAPALAADIPAWSPRGVQPTFSPDGSVIACDSAGAPPGIWIVGPSGNPDNLLIPNAAQAAWSPDGRKIAYVGPNGLCVANADGSGETPLGVLYAGRPTWSPDGTRLAFHQQNPATGVSQIWTIQVDGTGLTQVSNPVNSDSDPAWSPF